MPAASAWRRSFRGALLVLFHLAVGLGPLSSAARAQPGYESDGAVGFEAKTLAKARRHMIAAANPNAVAAGLSILDAGGSALDAAIAAQLVLNLVEPQSSGIGGGGFLLHWDARARRLRSYDGRETAPAGIAPDVFMSPGGGASGQSGLREPEQQRHRRHFRRTGEEGRHRGWRAFVNIRRPHVKRHCRYFER